MSRILLIGKLYKHNSSTGHGYKFECVCRNWKSDKRPMLFPAGKILRNRTINLSDNDIFLVLEVRDTQYYGTYNYTILLNGEKWFFDYEPESFDRWTEQKNEE